MRSHNKIAAVLAIADDITVFGKLAEREKYKILKMGVSPFFVFGIFQIFY